MTDNSSSHVQLHKLNVLENENIINNQNITNNHHIIKHQKNDEMNYFTNDMLFNIIREIVLNRHKTEIESKEYFCVACTEGLISL